MTAELQKEEHRESSTEELVIRPMQESDLDQVVAIDRMSFTLPWPATSFRYELKDNPRSLLYVIDALQPAGQHRVVGMIVVWLIIDEAHIATLAIHPQYRRRKLSQKLLAVALVDSIRKGAKEAILEVRAGNDAAQALYRRFHFEIIGSRPRYYKDNNEDALIMKADLGQIDHLGCSYLEWLESFRWDGSMVKEVET